MTSNFDKIMKLDIKCLRIVPLISKSSRKFIIFMKFNAN